jgi:ferredoxin
MRVTVDEDRCRGHGVCCTICPDVFDLTDDGYSAVLTPVVPSEAITTVLHASRSCPERAITVDGD